MTKAAPFSFVLYILKTGSLVLCGLVLPLAPLPLTGGQTTGFVLIYIKIARCKTDLLQRAYVIIRVSFLMSNEY